MYYWLETEVEKRHEEIQEEEATACRAYVYGVTATGMIDLRLHRAAGDVSF